MVVNVRSSVLAVAAMFLCSCGTTQGPTGAPPTGMVRIEVARSNSMLGAAGFGYVVDASTTTETNATCRSVAGKTLTLFPSDTDFTISVYKFVTTNSTGPSIASSEGSLLVAGPNVANAPEVEGGYYLQPALPKNCRFIGRIDVGDHWSWYREPGHATIVAVLTDGTAFNIGNFDAVAGKNYLIEVGLGSHTATFQETPP